jgi:hypothetical protein
MKFCIFVCLNGELSALSLILQPITFYQKGKMAGAYGSCVRDSLPISLLQLSLE